MTFPAIQWALEQDCGDSAGQFILAMLGYRANGDGLAWPTIPTLSRMTKLDPKTIRHRLRRLAARGLIEDTGNRSGETAQIKVWRLRMDQSSLQLQPAKDYRKRQASKRSKGGSMRESLNGLKAYHERQSLEPTKDYRERKGTVNGSLPFTPLKTTADGTLKDNKDSREKANAFLSKAGNRDFQCAQIFAAWNDMAKANGLPTALKLTPDRKSKLKNRIDEHGAAAILEALETIPQSRFLTGHGPDGWRAHFDFLLQPSSMLKLIEGSYREAQSDKDKPLWQIIAERDP